jgi:hypothetical protein
VNGTVNLPFASVVLVIVTCVESKVRLIAELAAKPVPVIVTEDPTIPLTGLSWIERGRL